jgi:hypothetical protein
MSNAPSETWLTLDEAAALFGVGRLRLREAIAAGLLQGRRDNRGSWRVLLPDAVAGMAAKIHAERAAPEALVELLFDEIEEMNLLLAERDASLERLSAVAARQQEMLARALSLAETPAPAGASRDGARLAELNERSTALIETALDKLVRRDDDIAKLTGIVDRALTAMGGLEAELKRRDEVVERQKGLLERLFALANTRLERFAKSEPRGGGLLDRLRDRLGGNRSGGG